MANLDSRSKRASSVGIMMVTTLAPVLPDGTIGDGDRQHIAGTYSGILSGGAVAEVLVHMPTMPKMATMPTQWRL